MIAILRHACAYAVANRWHDTRALQAYLGHRNIQQTVRYTELSPTWFKNLRMSVSRSVRGKVYLLKIYARFQRGKDGQVRDSGCVLVGLSNSAFARDDGRYANDPLKHWFDNLTSSNGNCCSFADGLSISDVDWDTKDGHYRVLLHGEWISANSAVVTEPNRYGPAVVWPYMDTDGNIYIRCFLPGSGA